MIDKHDILKKLELLYIEDPTTQNTAFWKFKNWLSAEDCVVIPLELEIESENKKKNEKKDEKSSKLDFAVILENNLIWQYPYDSTFMMQRDPLFDLALIRFNNLDSYEAFSKLGDFGNCADLCDLRDLRDLTNSRDFNDFLVENYNVELFFKLYHKLIKIPKVENNSYSFREVLPEEIEQVIAFINHCYTHIKVNTTQVNSWRISEHFSSDLWQWVIDPVSGEKLALGIAELDTRIKEGALEWIQVSPEHQGKGIGKILVCELLSLLKLKADFVTVSGEVSNLTKPEKLYRSCGFVGDAIWGVYRKKVSKI